MNYHAHIPAGVTFAAGTALIMGWGFSVPLLIGGAIGGALPDIDIEGSAIEKLGTKSAEVVNKAFGGTGGKRFTKIITALGKILDALILKPVSKLWRLLSQYVFGAVYRKLYESGANGRTRQCFGERMHWLDEKKPWEHRGGITHSLSFLLTSSLFNYPFLVLLLGWDKVYIGIMAGIISHLIADSFCRSGVKFFFPWHPKVGFRHPNGGKQGHDVRLLPPSLQVVTGKDRITNKELDAYTDKAKAKEDRKLRRREKTWQWFFKALGLVLIIMLAYFTFSGKVSNADAESQNDEDSIGISATQDGSQSQPPAKDDNDPSQDIVTEGSSASGVNPTDDYSQEDMVGILAPENEGPTSLTSGDANLSDLPKGIIKLPDESLYIVGVGPVSKGNLENPKWVFTDDEKRRLLSLSMAQRIDGIPDKAEETVRKMTSDQNSNDNGNSGGLLEWLGEAVGIDNLESGYTGGFLGITPWTSTSN